LLEGKVHHVFQEILDPQLSIISPSSRQLMTKRKRRRRRRIRAV